MGAYRSVNTVTIVGRLGKDPELRNTNGGKQIANLSVATSEKWKNGNGDPQERTEWHRIVIFNEKLAEIADKYARKGDLVAIQGALQTRKWQDQGGVDRYSTEIVVSAYDGAFTILASPEGGGGGERRDDRRDDRGGRRDDRDRRDTRGRDDRRDDRRERRDDRRDKREEQGDGGGWSGGGKSRDTTDLDDDIPF